MEPLEKIDTILSWFNQNLSDNNEPAIVRRNMEPGYVYNNIATSNLLLKNDPDFRIEFQSILDQLVLDGYLVESQGVTDRDKNGMPFYPVYYSITFKGKLFLLEGGY